MSEPLQQRLDGVAAIGSGSSGVGGGDSGDSGSGGANNGHPHQPQQPQREDMVEGEEKAEEGKEDEEMHQVDLARGPTPQMDGGGGSQESSSSSSGSDGMAARRPPPAESIQVQQASPRPQSSSQQSGGTALSSLTPSQETAADAPANYDEEEGLTESELRGLGASQLSELSNSQQHSLLDTQPPDEDVDVGMDVNDVNMLQDNASTAEGSEPGPRAESEERVAGGSTNASANAAAAAAAAAKTSVDNNTAEEADADAPDPESSSSDQNNNKKRGGEAVCPDTCTLLHTHTHDADGDDGRSSSSTKRRKVETADQLGTQATVTVTGKGTDTVSTSAAAAAGNRDGTSSSLIGGTSNAKGVNSNVPNHALFAGIASSRSTTATATASSTSKKGYQGGNTGNHNNNNNNNNNSGPSHSIFSKRSHDGRSRKSMRNRPRRRRRRWTDADGVPSFLAILSGDTPPPSDDEEEIEDRACREREWNERGRFVVDVDALLGLAPPTEYVVEEDEDKEDGNHDVEVATAPAAASTEKDSANQGGTTVADGDYSDKKKQKAKLKKTRSGKSALYRIGSDVRARIFDAAVGDGSVLPIENSDNDVVILSDGRAADPFLAPGLVLGPINSTGGASEVTAHGIPAAVKSEYLAMPASSSSSSGPQRYYEGVRPLALPDDEDYLPELHCLIRQNLELFSATEADVADKAYGKRTPVVRGKVGIRCVHCKRATEAAAPDVVSSSHTTAVYSSASAPSPQRKSKYIGGSVSYISSLSTMSNIAGQKPSLHFASCPYIPTDIKQDFHRLTHDEDGMPLRQRTGAVVMGKLGISPTKYWLVAARRVGLVDVKSGGGGIRFIRDPSLPPRSVDEVIAEDPTLGKPMASTAVAAAASSISQPPQLMRAGGGEAFNAQGVRQHPAIAVAKIKGDEESEKVLKETIADIKTQEEDASKNFSNQDVEENSAEPPPPYLVQSEDLKLVSDFFFLTAAQLAVVYASSLDMYALGKRSKSVKMGCAGITCRACFMATKQHGEGRGMGFGYEAGIAVHSYPSGDGALCTTVTQTLYNHFHKCPHVRQEIKAALIAYKRIHMKQVAQLPRGANGRFYKMLWARLRSMDKSPGEMINPTVRGDETPAVAAAVPPPQGDNTNEESIVSRDVEPLPSSSSERPAGFPTSNDKETLSVVAAAIEDGADELLLQQSEVQLVTEFVFLIMKQLAPCLPTAIDHKFRKNMGKAGVCCKGCLAQGQGAGYGGTGRTFPSAPDNFASSLKTTMFSHLCQCDSVPEPTKRALKDLKSLHTDQMAALKFGAQRQYLRQLHNRLTAWARQAPPPEMEHVEVPQVADDKTLEENGFAASYSGKWFCCIRCRMVPMELRAAGSMSKERPNQTFVQQHNKICKENAFDLSTLLAISRQMVHCVPGASIDLLTNPAFKEFVRSLVGDNGALVNILTEGVVNLDRSEVDATSSKSDDAADGDVGLPTLDSKGLWSSFPSRIDTRATKLLFENLLREVDEESGQLLRNNTHLKSYITIVAPSCIDLAWMEES